MISYKIIITNGKNVTPNQRKHITPKDPEFKSLVFERSLKKCTFKENQWVKIKGTSKRGRIIEVIKELDKVTWTNNRPYYLVLEMTDKSQVVANPAQLKGKSH